LQLALHTPDLDGCIIYYGRLVNDPQQVRNIKAPVLGIFGNRDKGIPPAEVGKFQKALEDAEVANRILSFEADHAFANPSGERYDAVSAEAAWSEVRAFLRARLWESP
jgi:carboxymethylenebutenolidase